MEKSDLGYESIIPSCRVFINEEQSKLAAYIRWVITDVNNFDKRGSHVVSIKVGVLEIDTKWLIVRDGHGLVPLKIKISSNHPSKKVTIIF
jgi:hypothetical protein